MKKTWNKPTIIPQLPVPKPGYTVLPAKQDGQGKLIRSYPGDPDEVGWTIFIHTSQAYQHSGDPLFYNEQDAKHFLEKQYGVSIHLNRNPCEPRYH